MTEGAADAPVEPLIHGLFDYAGMFPPANLSFERALAESAQLPRTLRRPHLLAADMALKLDDLSKLTPQALKHAGFTRPCKVCLVGVPLADAEDAIAKALAAPAGTVVALECSFEAVNVQRMLDVATHIPPGMAFFVEPRWTPAQWAMHGDELWLAMDAVAARGVGLKIRMAGPTALDARTLATILDEVAARRMPFKATQGLHHPLPTAEFPVGFLNVAMALRVALAGGDTLACLLETDSQLLNLRGWGGIPTDPLPFPFAVGSCSLSEPDDDLAALS